MAAMIRRRTSHRKIDRIGGFFWEELTPGGGAFAKSPRAAG
jgi:hypothetical protein